MNVTHEMIADAPVSAPSGWKLVPVEPTEKCRPEDHGNLNYHVNEIKDAMTGETIWKRVMQ